MWSGLILPAPVFLRPKYPGMNRVKMRLLDRGDVGVKSSMCGHLQKKYYNLLFLKLIILLIKLLYKTYKVKKKNQFCVYILIIKRLFKSLNFSCRRSVVLNFS